MLRKWLSAFPRSIVIGTTAFLLLTALLLFIFLSMDACLLRDAQFRLEEPLEYERVVLLDNLNEETRLLTLYTDEVEASPETADTILSAYEELTAVTETVLVTDTPRHEVRFSFANGAFRMDNGRVIATIPAQDISERLLGANTIWDNSYVLLDSRRNVLLAPEEADLRYLEQTEPVLRGENGFKSIGRRGENWYFAYKAFGINDWYIASCVRASEVLYVRYAFANRFFMLAFCLYALFIGCCAMSIKAVKKRSAERLLQEQMTRACRTCLQILAEYPGSLLCDTDLTTDKTYLYGSFMSVFGRDPVLTNFPFGAERAGMLSEEDSRHVAGLMDAARRGVERSKTNINMRRQDGSTVPCLLYAQTLKNEDGVPFRVITRITEEKDIRSGRIATEDLDETTGLPGRLATMDMMEKALDERPRALLMLDIDNSTRLDDLFGYEERERIIKEIAGVIKNALRGDDLLGRTGVDEFVVLLQGITEEATVRELVARIQSGIAGIGAKRQIELTISAGCVLSAEEHPSIDTLYFKADTAQYTAKQTGRRKLIMYNE